jgi:hypothetical protein
VVLVGVVFCAHPVVSTTKVVTKMRLQIPTDRVISLCPPLLCP